MADRLQTAMASAGIKKASELARMAGVNPITMRAYLAGTRKAPLDVCEVIGQKLGVSGRWLFDGSRPRTGTSSYAKEQPVPVAQVHVRGNVQAGIWTEFEEFPDAAGETIPTVPGRYASLEQWAYRVGGTSMTKARLFDGDYVICVPYFMARKAVTNADLVVVERRRGGATERTVKQIEIDQSGACRLWPRSDDPRFQAPIPCDGPEPDGTEIEIIGLVIGSFTPR